MTRGALLGAARNTEWVPVDPKELVERCFRAFNEGGASAFIDYLVSRDALAPDFVMAIQADAPNGGEWHGAAGFEEMARTWLEAWEVFEIQPDELIELAPGRILVPVHQRAVTRGSGLELNERFFYTVRLVDGRFQRMGLFNERSLAEAELGLRPGED